MNVEGNSVKTPDQIKGQRLTGFSFSYCIRDIVDRGLIEPGQVDRIIAGIMVHTADELETLMKGYEDIEWRFRGDTEKTERCKQLGREFYNAGKIVQPRLEGKKAPLAVRVGKWSITGDGKPFNVVTPDWIAEVRADVERFKANRLKL